MLSGRASSASRRVRVAAVAPPSLGLEKQGYDFVIASAPNVNRLTIGVLALVVEQERRDISIRTKAALAMAKARSVKLGRPENLSRQDVGRCAVTQRSRGRPMHAPPICCR
jgi:DNA invertase Pin-like site-specific DNA recombinase